MRYRRVYSSGATYFFTVVTSKRLPLFSNEMSVALLREAMSAEMKRRPFKIDAMVVLPDHFHALWTLPLNDSDYSIRWRNIKRSLTEKIKLSGGQVKTVKQSIWQRRFWEHRIRDNDDLIHHINYIHYNPVKHGLVINPIDWQYSSIHRFIKQGNLEANWGTDNSVNIPKSIGHE